MTPSFQELDYRATPIGTLSLRRRRDPGTGEDVYEIKLGDAFLMSSRFTVSEVALARSALAAHGGTALDVLVGGLGLGCTAHAALEHDTVTSLLVVELLDPVVEWHRSGLLPLGPMLTADPRCRLVSGDFFAMTDTIRGFDVDAPGRRFDAVLLDIDHSPVFLLDERSRDFYAREGLRKLTRHLKPGGIFALWSNDRPDPAFTDRLASVFDDARAEAVEFFNPLQNRMAVQSVYLARIGSRREAVAT